MCSAIWYLLYIVITHAESSLIILGMLLTLAKVLYMQCFHHPIYLNIILIVM